MERELIMRLGVIIMASIMFGQTLPAKYLKGDTEKETRVKVVIARVICIFAVLINL